ncbi:hypothetical protein [Frankia sp. EAN1pec]
MDNDESGAVVASSRRSPVTSDTARRFADGTLGASIIFSQVLADSADA